MMANILHILNVLANHFKIKLNSGPFTSVISLNGEIHNKAIKG